MKLLVLLSALLFTFSAYAGQSGYILNGKIHVVYKDGEKVGEYPEEGKRKPNAIEKGMLFSMVRFEEDDLARCYFTAHGNANSPVNASLFCVKR